MTTTSLRGLIAAALLAAAGSLSAQQPKPTPAPAPAPTPAPAPVQDGTTQDGKLDEWPELKQTDKDLVRSLAKQFHKEEKLHEEARQRLEAIGAGAAPILIRLVSDRANNINGELFKVLDKIVAREHAALLAREVGGPSVELRRYLLRRLCHYPDPTLVAVFTPAANDKDPEVAFLAALGLLVNKQKPGLAGVLAAARTRWSEVGALLADVLPAARSADCATWVLEAIAPAQPAEQMAGLRLLRYLMVDQQRFVLRTYLQAPDHTVKREAINTARALAGEAPIENLSVFQAIEMAKKWLEKL